VFPRSLPLTLSVYNPRTDERINQNELLQKWIEMDMSHTNVNLEVENSTLDYNILDKFFEKYGRIIKRLQLINDKCWKSYGFFKHLSDLQELTIKNKKIDYWSCKRTLTIAPVKISVRNLILKNADIAFYQSIVPVNVQSLNHSGRDTLENETEYLKMILQMNKNTIGSISLYSTKKELLSELMDPSYNLRKLVLVYCHNFEEEIASLLRQQPNLAQISLNISSNYGSPILSFLSKDSLRYLRNLNLNTGKIHNSVLKNLKSLQKLHLSLYNSLSWDETIALPQIRHISLNGLHFETNIFACLPNIQVLKLSQTINTDQAVEAAASSCRHIKYLYVYDEKVDKILPLEYYC
jgi:hypothetical protein